MRHLYCGRSRCWHLRRTCVFDRADARIPSLDYSIERRTVVVEMMKATQLKRRKESQGAKRQYTPLACLVRLTPLAAKLSAQCSVLSAQRSRVHSAAHDHKYDRPTCVTTSPNESIRRETRIPSIV